MHASKQPGPSDKTPTSKKDPSNQDTKMEPLKRNRKVPQKCRHLVPTPVLFKMLIKTPDIELVRNLQNIVLVVYNLLKKAERYLRQVLLVTRSLQRDVLGHKEPGKRRLWYYRGLNNCQYCVEVHLRNMIA